MIRRLLVLVVLLAVVAGAFGTWHQGLLGRWLEDRPPRDADPATPANPANLAPPSDLELPAVRPPPAVAVPIRPGNVSADKVRRKLVRFLDDPDLGRHVLASVSPLAGEGPLFESGSGLAVPASTTKLFTTAAALLALGPDHVFETRVVAEGRRRIVLVGGGDPYLALGPPGAQDEPPYPRRADISTLAQRTAKALRQRGIRRVTLGYDDTLFSGPTVSPQWRRSYIPDGVVSPITALWVDGGRPASGFGRVPDPALTAAVAFAGVLERAGVEVDGAALPVPEPVETGRVVASVTSAPLSMIVERVLDVSDNEASEVLLRHVGLATRGVGSFAAGRRGVILLMGDAGIDLGAGILYDGSGLSRQNRLDPESLIDVLQLAASPDHPELRAVVTGLPVAGFTGSLALRFDEAAREGRGRVRAKTGTLTGVSTLAGFVTDLDGNPMVFVLMADKVALEDTLDARDTLDTAAAALGACRCGR